MGVRLRVLPAALLLAPVLACQGSAPGDAPDLLAMLPADIDLVAFVDASALRAHPLFEQLRKDPFLQGGDETLNQLQEVTGLDPVRDFDLLLFAAQNLGEPEMEIAVLARGGIDRGRLEGLLQQTGWKVSRQGGLELYSLPFTGEGVGGLSGLEGLAGLRVTFLDDFTIALGSKEILEATAEVRSGHGESLVETSDLGPMIADGLGSGQFWGAFRSGYLARQLRGRIEDGIPGLGILRGFSGVRGIRFSMRFSDSIDLVTRAHTQTDEEAQLLADTLNGFLALAKLFAKDRPDVLRFLEGTLVGLDLDSVRLSMNVDAGTLERIRGGLFQQIGSGGL